MRIVFLNSIQMFGGGEVWLLRTMRAFRDRGHDVQLVCRPRVPLEKRARDSGFHVHAVRFRGDFDPVATLKIWRILRKCHTDVICTNMDKELRVGGLAAVLAGVKAIVPRRGSDYPLKNTLAYQWSYGSLADGVIANSESTKQTLLKNAPWLDPEKIRVIYNGIDPGPFQDPPRTNIRRIFGIPQDQFLVGFVGLLDERKGVSTLVRAFGNLLDAYPETHLLLAGEGRMESSLREQSKSFQTHVTFAGFRDDIPEIMKSIDALVLPSLWEGFGIVLIEAMAAGKPVITTQVSNMPEIVTHEQEGFLVPINDSDALQKNIAKLIDDPELQERMGKNGRETVNQRFTIDRMIDEIESYFNDLMQD